MLHPLDQNARVLAARHCRISSAGKLQLRNKQSSGRTARLRERPPIRRPALLGQQGEPANVHATVDDDSSPEQQQQLTYKSIVQRPTGQNGCCVQHEAVLQRPRHEHRSQGQRVLKPDWRPCFSRKLSQEYLGYPGRLYQWKQQLRERFWRREYHNELALKSSRDKQSSLCWTQQAFLW
jgi:hypothetical protein